MVWVSSEAHHNPTFWQYHTPNIIVDAAAGTVGQLALDLRGVTESAGDWAGLVGFLMRRKAPLAPPPLVADPGELLLGVARGALQDKAGSGVLRAMFRHLVEVSGWRVTGVVEWRRGRAWGGGGKEKCREVCGVRGRGGPGRKKGGQEG
jgi:hypothetical protein